MTSASFRALVGQVPPRRALALAAAAVLGLAGLSTAVRQARVAIAAPAAAPATYLESKRTFEDESFLAPNESVDPSISGDGRFVAFVGPGGDQVLAAASGSTAAPVRRSVWLRDRAFGTLTEVTPYPGTVSMHPSISRDGCYVGFVTTAPLDPRRDKGVEGDVYTWRNPHKRTCAPVTGAATFTLVSARPSGAAIDATSPASGTYVRPSQRPALSADGTVVAYVAAGSIAAAVGTPGGLNAGYLEPSVYVVDLTKAPEEDRTVTPPDRQDGPGQVRVVGSLHPALTDDGSTLVYATDANPFADPVDPQGGWAVRTGCSVATAAACSVSSAEQVYTWQVGGSSTSSFRLVSRAAGVSPTSPSSTGWADRPSFNPVVSADGRRIAFSSLATDLLVPFAPSTALQTYVYDVPTDTMALVSRVEGMPGDGDSGEAYPAPGPLSDLRPMHSGLSISGDGRAVAFHSAATTLSSSSSTLAAPADLDIFVAPLSDAGGVTVGALEQVNVDPAGLPAGGEAAQPALSTTARFVAFDSARAFGLVGQDDTVDQQRGVLVRDRLSNVTITPNPLAFGAVGIGGTAAGTATVTNRGPGSWVFAVAFASGAFKATGAGTCQLGTFLAPGGSCTVAVAFVPHAIGPAAGGLRAYADPATDFTASIGCGTPSDDPACDYWRSINPVTDLTGLGAEGVAAASTTTVASSSSTSRPSNPTTAVGGAPTTKPGATTVRPATTRPPAASTAKPGTTAPPPRHALRLEAPAGDFGITRVGSPSAPRVFQLRNTGNVPNAVASAATSGINAEEFVVTENGCQGRTLGVDQTCPLTVVHTPRDSGGRAATLVAFGQGGSNASSVLLSSGIYTPSIAFSPAVVTPGRTTQLVGTGFPVSSPITLGWVGEDQPPIFTITDASGGVRLSVFVLPNQGAGTRTMVVADQPGRFGAAAAATLLIALPTYQPQANNPALPRANFVSRG